MYSEGLGMGFGSLFMWAIWILIIFSIFALFKLFFKQNGGSEQKPEDDSLEILKQRFARGEIDAEEFERMKKTLMNR